MEKNSGMRCRLEAETRVEGRVAHESGKGLMAQEQLGMELLKTEEAFS